jgi:hypothetical protein
MVPDQSQVRERTKILATVLVIAALAIAVHQITSPRFIKVGPFRIRPDTLRPLGVGAMAALVLIVSGWRSVLWRSLGVVTLISCFCLFLVVVAHPAAGVARCG